MTPEIERPGVHVPGPFTSNPRGTDDADSSERLCSLGCGSPAVAMPLTWSLCPTCHPVWLDKIRERVAMLDRERTVGVGRPVCIVDGWPSPWMRLRCDRCPREWVGIHGETCPTCEKYADVERW